MTYLPMTVSVPNATPGAAGLVQPDGVSITVVNGVISAVGSGALTSQPLAVSAATQVLAFATGARETSYAVTLGQACAFTIGAALPGAEQIMTIDLIQGAGGGFTPSFTNVSWASGVAPAFNTATTKRDTIQVRAIGSDVMGWPVSMGRAPLVAAVPAAPAGLTVTAGVQQATISVPAVMAYPAVQGYNIYAGASAGVEPATPVATGVALPYIELGLPAGVARFYKVAAVNTIGEGAKSAEGSAVPLSPGAVPTAPVSISVTPAAGQNAVTAATVTASPFVTGYTIRRGTTPGGEAPAPVAANVTLPWVDLGLVNGTIYYYQVAAVNALGTGAFSAEGSGTPTAAVSRYALFSTTDCAIYTPPNSAFNPGASAFEMQARCRMANWATGGSVETNLFGCWDLNVAKRLWRLGVTTDGRIRASWATGASTSVTATSTAVIGAPGGTDLWLRAAVTPGSGAVVFYTSVDGTAWTALGTTQTATGTGAVYTPAALPYLVIGANASAPSGPQAEQFAGRFYEARLLINGALVTDPVAGTSGTTDSGGFVYSSAGVTYV